MTFALVHSPLVGPTTWSPVARELKRRGREAVVPSLLGVADAAAPQWRHVPDAVQATTAVVILTVFAFAAFFQVVDSLIFQTITKFYDVMTK